MNNKKTRHQAFAIILPLILLGSLLISSSVHAQLTGDDTVPGTACPAKGAVRMTANATGPGAYILTCDADAPTGKWVATLNTSSPTSSAQVANKGYVDTAIAAGGGGGGAGIYCVSSKNGCNFPFFDTGMEPSDMETGGNICCTTGAGITAAPDNLAFTDLTNQMLTQTVHSNIIPVSGLGQATVPVTASGSGNPHILINGGTAVKSGTISNGDTLRLRMVTADAFSTTSAMMVHVGTASAQWSVTTGATCQYFVAGTAGQQCPGTNLRYSGTMAGGKRVYVLLTDQGSAMWKTSMGTNDIATDSDTDGLANTNQVPNNSTFPAFKLCKDMNVNGHTGWYLPARNELANMFPHRGVLTFANADYRSSTEVDVNRAYLRQMGSNTEAPINKNIAYNVRCAWRE